MLRFWSAFLLVTIISAACTLHGAEKVDVKTFVARLRSEMKPEKFERQIKLAYGENTSVSHLAFAGDQKRIAAAYGNGDVVVWDTTTGKRVGYKEKRKGNALMAIALSETGRYLAWGEVNGKVMLRDLEMDKNIHHAKVAEVAVVAMSLSGGDDYLSIFDMNGRYQRIGLKKQKEVILDNPDKKQPWNRVAFQNSGENVFVSRRGSPEFTYLVAEEEGSRTYGLDAAGGDVQQLGGTDRYCLTLNEARLFAMHDYSDLKRTIIPFWSIRTSIAPDHPLRVTHDGRYVLLADKTGRAEIRDLASPAGCCRFKFPAERLTAWGWGNDGKTLALGSKNGDIAVLALPKPPVAPEVEVGRVLRDALAVKDYEFLEAVFAEFQHEVRPFAWAANRTPCEALADELDAGEGMDDPKPGHLPRLLKWMQDRPHSTTAQLLVGRQYVLDGWKIRGGDVAARVKPEAWKEFYAQLDGAELVLRLLAKDEKPPPMALTFLFQVATARSWDEEKWRPYADKLMKSSPECFEAHASLMTRMMPRWGGGATDVIDYATKVSDGVGGPDGDALYARLARAQQRYVRNWPDYQAIGFDDARVLRGWEHLAKTAPDKRFAANAGLYLAARTKDVERVRTFAKFLAGENPANAWDMVVWDREEEYLEALKVGAGGE